MNILRTVQRISNFHPTTRSIAPQEMVPVSSSFPSLKDVASIGDAHLKLMQAGSRDDLAQAANHDRIWGPILQPAAKGCGALAAASSVLLFPTKLEPGLWYSVLELLPDALVSKMSDTSKSLSQRLASCDFLDPITTLSQGNGKKGYVLLNRTDYSQARRKSWSCTVEQSPLASANVNDCVNLLCYPHLYRPSKMDYYCAPMPMPVFVLGVELWKTAWPYLTEVSKKTPTNHCELLCYYTLFGGSMGRHRDNFKSNDLRDYLATGKDPRAGRASVQITDSNVLIWSMGNAPMTMSLSFPPKDGDPGERSSYIVHPTFQFELAAGTLFVFAPLDDLFFCHETEFLRRVLEAVGAAGHRFAFVYRWLEEHSGRPFHADTGKVYASPEELAAWEVTRKAAQTVKNRKRRRDVGL
jgi:hypothetical protein